MTFFLTERRVVACLVAPADGDCQSYILLQPGRQRNAGRQWAQGRQPAQTVRIATGDQTISCRRSTRLRGCRECVAGLSSTTRRICPSNVCSWFPPTGDLLHSPWFRGYHRTERIPTVHVQPMKQELPRGKYKDGSFARGHGSSRHPSSLLVLPCATAKNIRGYLLEICVDVSLDVYSRRDDTRWHPAKRS